MKYLYLLSISLIIPCILAEYNPLAGDFASVEASVVQKVARMRLVQVQSIFDVAKRIYYMVGSSSHAKKLADIPLVDEIESLLQDDTLAELYPDFRNILRDEHKHLGLDLGRKMAENSRPSVMNPSGSMTDIFAKNFTKLVTMEYLYVLWVNTGHDTRYERDDLMPTMETASLFLSKEMLFDLAFFTSRKYVQPCSNCNHSIDFVRHDRFLELIDEGDVTDLMLEVFEFEYRKKHINIDTDALNVLFSDLYPGYESFNSVNATGFGRTSSSFYTLIVLSIAIGVDHLVVSLLFIIVYRIRTRNYPIRYRLVPWTFKSIIVDVGRILDRLRHDCVEHDYRCHGFWYTLIDIIAKCCSTATILLLTDISIFLPAMPLTYGVIGTLIVWTCYLVLDVFHDITTIWYSQNVVITVLQVISRYLFHWRFFVVGCIGFHQAYPTYSYYCRMSLAYSYQFATEKPSVATLEGVLTTLLAIGLPMIMYNFNWYLQLLTCVIMIVFIVSSGRGIASNVDWLVLATASLLSDLPVPIVLLLILHLFRATKRSAEARMMKEHTLKRSGREISPLPESIDRILDVADDFLDWSSKHEH